MEKTTETLSGYLRKDYKQIESTKRTFVYDIECLVGFFCVVFKCFGTDETNIFVISKNINEQKELLEFLDNHVDCLMGYNNLFYDAQLIEFIRGRKHVDNYSLYHHSQRTIDSEWPEIREWDLSIQNLDIYKILHLDNKNRMVGLKWCEYMTDWENIEDMPHQHYQHLNEQEEIETLLYCINDVDATKHLFKINMKAIILRHNLSQQYGINFMNASNSKIGSDLVLDLYCKATGKRKWDVKKLRTYRTEINFNDIIFPYIQFESEELNNFLNKLKSTTIKVEKEEGKKKKAKLLASIIYKGFRFDYGLGGIHGSLKNCIVTINDDEELKDADVASLYPSIAVQNNLYPQHLGVEFALVYNNDIVKVRLAEKAKPNGNKSIIDALKEAANSVYG